MVSGMTKLFAAQLNVRTQIYGHSFTVIVLSMWHAMELSECIWGLVRKVDVNTQRVGYVYR